MRAVLQRVSRASVEVEGEAVCEIGAGLLALVAVGSTDNEDDARKLAAKIVRLRIFDDPDGRMNRSLLDEGGELAVVSQFTLFGDCRNGRRPFYGAAARPEVAEPLLAVLVEEARALGCPVVEGKFRAEMKVSLVNEGPVTLLVDTQEVF